MPEQVASPPASDAAPAEPAVETPQPTEPQAAVSRPAGPESTEPQSVESRPAEPQSAGSQSAESQSAAPKSESGEPESAAPKSESESGEPESESAESRPADPESAEPEVKKSGATKVLGIVGAILAVVVVAGLKFGVVSAIGNVVNKDETAAAKAGDCIAKLPEVSGTKQEKVTDAKIVECTSTEAAYNVVGRVDGQTEAQAQASTACEQYFKPDQEGYIYSSIMPGKTGYVLCLTKKA
ncbi:hypothetical protein [Micromonospora sp. NPDC023888]|uniref:LppU/SCO3897 family protein n=1 Tax=Micromonospora sp. NPDC023888 TaxID=3155607 RepID=UPI0033C570C4